MTVVIVQILMIGTTIYIINLRNINRKNSNKNKLKDNDNDKDKNKNVEQNYS